MSEPRADHASLERFLTELQDRSGLSREQAERAGRATLRALGESISAGQVRELGEWVPPQLRPELTEHEGLDKAFDRDQFLALVADGVPDRGADSVEGPARATLQTLRANAPAEDVESALAQLPPALTELFHRGP